MREIKILSENPIEQIWLHLSKWESKTLALRLIRERARQGGVFLDDERADAKAQGLAYCLRNAREYLRDPEASWNKRLLNGYYGLMSLVGAIMIADPASDYDLAKFELAAKMGHGLNNVDDPAAAFPDAQKVYVTEDGLLVRYLASLGVGNRDLKLGRKDAERALHTQDPRLMSLDTLLASIPELHDLYFDVTGRRPLSVGVFFHSDLNWNSARGDEAGDLVGEFLRAIRLFDPSVEEPDRGVWLGLRSNEVIDEQAARSQFHLPFEKYQTYRDDHDGREYLAGFLPASSSANWKSSMGAYGSAMADTVYAAPLVGRITDTIAVHYCLMYALSIIVRYRPSLWREISEGRHDDYFALIKYYFEAFVRVVPELALGRIADASVHASRPGAPTGPS